MRNLQSYKPGITILCEIHKVRKLYAFGSVVTERFNTNSDIDLIVKFKQINLEDYADNYFDFKFSLQDILKRPIDLLEEQAINNSYFRKSIKESKQLIYIAPDYPVSKEQISRIEESKKQINQGKYLTNEEANNLVDQWLNN